MIFSKEKAKENLSKLIAKFEQELVAGHIKEYNEEAVKIAFIQPLLKDVLGWDVNNHDEVSPEEKTSRGRVDYGLKVDGKIRIFIEAKPPKVDLRKHVEQAVGYGYNRKGVPFVLLTDFEGLKLFDVTVKPDVRNPLKGLKIDLGWDQYLEEFEKLWLLSRESVAKGELDKLLLIKPKEGLPVDKAILDDLKKWRELLAKDIFKNNPELFHSEDREKGAGYLKEIAQRILDRIIFMRSCEDRGLIHRRPLKELFEERTETVGTNTMIFLKEEFKHYNINFDSDLFRPQEWENNLAIDFKVIREIVLDTYNPYQFDVIPLEVLGNIYEQYLGYTIRLTDHQVKYELKPEVRKAGGVYYTPEYIVDYIVKNTVGKLLQELSPRKIKKLRILDPACGSGSFLIRAYEKMLNYYKDQKKKKIKAEDKQRKLELGDGETGSRLTIQEKSQILQEHIFGVDIDEQAVEVTKLSLMLKMLAGEYGIIPGRAILPMLDENIKCGNSLISGDTLELKKYFGDDWYKAKAFNWEDEFKKVMVDEWGFDVVIGNPPYRSLLLGKKHKSEDKKLVNYYERTLPNASQYKMNLFGLFMEKCSQLLSHRGLFSFIIPNLFFTSYYFKDLRRFLLENGRFVQIIDLRYKVFDQVEIGGSGIFVFTPDRSIKQSIISTANSIEEFEKSRKFIVGSNAFLKNHNFSLLIDPDTTKVIDRINHFSCVELGSICTIYQGIITGDNKKFLSKNASGKKWEKIIRGRDIGRYYLEFGGIYIYYEPKELWSNTNYNMFRVPEKLISRQTSDHLVATLDRSGYLTLDSTHVIHLSNPLFSLRYLLGIFNSRLINFLYTERVRESGRVFAQVKTVNLKPLPIRTIDFSNPVEKQLHDNIVCLVDSMLDLNKKIQSAKGSEKDQIQRQIEKTDREIDDLVYKLYGITEGERHIIEHGE